MSDKKAKQLEKNGSQGRHRPKSNVSDGSHNAGQQDHKTPPPKKKKKNKERGNNVEVSMAEVRGSKEPTTKRGTKLGEKKREEPEKGQTSGRGQHKCIQLKGSPAKIKKEEKEKKKRGGSPWQGRMKPWTALEKNQRKVRKKW